MRMEPSVQGSIASASQQSHDSPRLSRHTSIDRPNLGLDSKDFVNAGISNYIRLTPLPIPIGQSRNPWRDFMRGNSTTSTQNPTQEIHQHQQRRPQSPDHTSPELLADGATASMLWVSQATDIGIAISEGAWHPPADGSKPPSLHAPATHCDTGHGYMTAPSGAMQEGFDPSFDTEPVADDLWPPSIYEAAQHRYPVSILDDIASKSNSTSHSTMPHRSSLPNYSRSLPILPRDTSAQNKLISEDRPDRSKNSDGLDKGEKIARKPQPEHSQPHGQSDTLRCLVCVDKPQFTGRYAQRNFNRHMEKHSPCSGWPSRRHIRCRQPGCTSTFGREDALLVHLRRSHPEMDTPPAKKKKRVD